MNGLGIVSGVMSERGRRFVELKGKIKAKSAFVSAP